LDSSVERKEKWFEVTNNFDFFMLIVDGNCGGEEEDDNGRLLPLVYVD